jgi:hypothetical protein
MSLSIEPTNYDIPTLREKHFCRSGSANAILKTNISISLTLEGSRAKAKDYGRMLLGA